MRLRFVGIRKMRDSNAARSYDRVSYDLIFVFFSGAIVVRRKVRYMTHTTLDTISGTISIAG